MNRIVLVVSGIMLALVIVLGLFALGLFGRRVQRARVQTEPGSVTKTTRKVDYTFGYKIAWLAIRSDNRERVVDALHVTNGTPVEWQEGIHAAYDEQGAFVSSPAGGWVFIVDRNLMSAVEDDKALLAERLRNLSLTFGEAQYFLNYRVSSCHAWIRAKDGKIVRGYASLDGTIYWNEGRITIEELAIRVASAESRATHMHRVAKLKPETYSKEAEELTALAQRLAKMTPETYSEVGDQYFPDEDDVIKMAGKWSIDPETLDENIVRVPNGVLGKLQKK